MEEKPKTIQISMSGLFLIIAILVIAGMSVWIYMQNQNSKEEITKLEEDKAALQNQVNILQGKRDTINTTINDTSLPSSSKEISKDSSDVTNKNTVKNSTSFNGTFKHKNTKITFDDTTFNAYLDENFSVNGVYEILDDKTIICNISEYSFSSPNGIQKNEVNKNEKWSMSFNIKNEKNLEVRDIILPDREAEIIIGLFNAFEVGNKFILQ